MATYSYDIALEPTYVDFADIGSGYGILSVPIDGFLPGDVVQTVALTIAPRTGTGATITKAIDMVQRADGFFEYVTQEEISAHFTILAADLVAIAAGTYAYSVSASVLRSGLTVTREVQAGNINARPASLSPGLVVSTIALTGGPLTGNTGSTAPLTAVAKDAYGNTIAGQIISWSSSNPLVAQVDQSGLVTFLIPGTATITASAQGVSATTTATAQDPAFSAPVDGQVATYVAARSRWEPVTPTPALFRPGTFGDNVAHDPYIFPHGVQAQTFAGDGSALTNLNVGAASSGVLPVARGGSGLGTMGAIGAILYASAALALAALAGNTSTTKKFLSQTGDGVNSAAPTWAQPVAADISDLATAATGITKVGTVTVGTWNGTAIVDTFLATIATAGKVANSATTATSANTVSAIVARDSNGDFTARNITATLFAGSGASLTNLNASQLTSGSIAATVGGTGQTAVVTGDLLYGSAANTWSRLGGNSSTTRELLISTGTGAAAQAPSWGTLVAGDIPSIDASKITSGTLTESVGGTGQSSYAIGDTLYASGTTSLARVAGNVAVGKKFLTQAGNGATASAPQWWALVASDIGAGTFSGAFTFVGLTLTDTLTSTLGTITGSKPWLSSTATWNAGGTVFTHMLVNITDTASDPTSLFQDWQVASVSKWKIDKTGAVKTGIWNGTAITNAFLATGIDVTKLTVGTTLPSNVVTSSLTAVGTIATGVWNGTSIGTTWTDAKVKTVTGTVNRLAIGGTATDPTFDIDAAYVGQATITTLGTVTTGTWSATTIATTKGGTGLTTYTLGDLVYSDAANSLAKLAGNIAVQPKFLMQTGSGAVSAAPAWHTLVVADVTDITTAATGITKVGTVNTGTWQATVLDPTYGGTGVNNGAHTLTLAGNLVTVGASSITFTSTGATSVTLPTSGTLATTAGNVATATQLQNVRTIWGQNFDGSANVSGAITGATTGGFSGIVTASGFTVSAAVGKIIPGVTSLSLRNTADSADNLLVADSGAITVRSTIGGVTTISGTTATFTNLGGTLSTAAQPNITSTGILASPHMTSAVVDSGGMTITAGGLTISGAASITGGAGNMTVLAGTGASRTLIFQTTTAGSAATTALTLNADQSASFAAGASFVGALTGVTSLTMNGALSGVNTLGVAGLITSTLGANTTLFTNTSGATGYQLFVLTNTGGDARFALNGSTAAAILSGGTAYATIVATANATGIDFGTNSARRGGFSSTGAFDVNNGLTVSAGTTAVQTLTATSATVTASTSAIIALDTTTGAASDNNAVFFKRGGVIKWRIGNNVTGTNIDAFNIYNDALGNQVLAFANTTGLATFTAGVTMPTLVVNTSLNNFIGTIQNSNANPFGVTFGYNAATPNNTSNQFMTFGDLSATRAELRSNGGLANFSANNVNLSDETVKEMGPSLDGALLTDAFRRINPRLFKYRDQTHSDWNIGFGARELFAAFQGTPYADSIVDREGWSADKLWAIYESDFSHAMAAVVKHGITRVDDIEARLAKMDLQLTQLKDALPS